MAIPFLRMPRPLRWQWNGWALFLLAIALLLSSPVLVVLSSIFLESSAVWQHLVDTVLLRYVQNSFWLCLGVGFGVLVIGVSTAWLVTMCRFRGSELLEWLLLVPLAAPAYVLAYTYTDFLAEYGWLQTALRNWMGWQVGEYWFPQMRSSPGAIVLLTLVLYPYVYLLARVAFLEQSACTLEASRVLGCGPWRSFWTIALPLARPSIIAGLSLAIMETLADFGTVEFFGVDTFTTGIYRTWFGLADRGAASQLAAVLLLVVLGLVVLERWSRGQARYYQVNTRSGADSRYTLSLGQSFLAWGVCGTPIFLGFLFPAGLLAWMLISTPDGDSQFWQYAGNSLILAAITALIGAVLATLIAYGLRLRSGSLVRLATLLASMGYAVPGSVIAVGVLVPLGRLDNTIDAWIQSQWGISTGLLLSGTIAALVFAYLVRFLAVAMNSVEASLGKIKPSLDDAARSLGYSPLSTLLKVHAPLLRGGLFTAAMLVFVDVMKELPATLVIRPFNFDTLAVRTYQLASDERLAEAASAALAIVLVGLLPVIFLSWQIARSRRRG